MVLPPKLAGTAMLSFEEGIKNLDNFKRVFMGSISNKNGVNISVNNEEYNLKEIFYDNIHENIISVKWLQ
jgi:hypothetical protein